MNGLLEIMTKRIMGNIIAKQSIMLQIQNLLNDPNGNWKNRERIMNLYRSIDGSICVLNPTYRKEVVKLDDVEMTVCFVKWGLLKDWGGEVILEGEWKILNRKATIEEYPALDPSKFVTKVYENAF
jgi:hypothetical protein